MPVNAHPEYVYAEKEYNNAETDEERLEALEQMIRYLPSHKGAETLRAQIKTRYKKLKEKVAREKKKAKARGKQQQGIRKLEMQAAIVGLTNTGKSSILKALTNADPKIASYGFTTQEPEQAILNYQGTQIQLVDLPPIGSEALETSIINTADTLLLVIEKIHEIPELQETIKKAKAKKILVFNKIDLQEPSAKRKIQETLKSKKHNFILLSTETGEGLEELKEKLFKSFNKIRIYTKEPKKKDPEPEAMILSPKSTVKDAARKALHGKAGEIKKAKVWGPIQRTISRIKT
jgi:small GTP-binding protein